MNDILLVLTVSVMNLLSFYFGSKLSRNEGLDIKLTDFNPMNKYREHKEIQEAKKEAERNDIIMQNIDNYDGTSNGQKDVPV